MNPATAYNRSENTELRNMQCNYREEFANNLLSDYMTAWQELSNKIKKYRPDIVIMASRRMPRTWQLLRRLDSGIFAEPQEFYSDFAIEYLGDKLAGKKVAVLDDTLNVGSTMLNIVERLEKLGVKEFKCFALAKLQDGGKALPDNFPIEYSREPLTKDEYRTLINRLARALWTINRPLELEFPVYVIKDVLTEYLNTIPQKLLSINSEPYCHRLDVDEASFIGLHRYSVDLSPEGKINNKLRLYVDTAKNELALMPIAHCGGNGTDVADWRRQRFVASIELMDGLWGKLGLDPKFATMDAEDCSLLFGADSPDLHLKTQILVPELEKTNFYNEIWPKFRDKCDPSRRWSFEDCLTTFFSQLSIFVDTDYGTKYSRLQIGPTFSELFLIMGILWKNDTPITQNKFHARLSSLLDIYIDQGSIVPVVDDEGYRRFRKGESNAWNKVFLSMLRSLGKDAKPETTIEEIQLNDNELQRYERMRHLYEVQLLILLNKMPINASL